MTLSANPLQLKRNVRLRLLAAGACSHPEALTLRGGTVRPVPFPAGFACIGHPEHGVVLFDTGYSARFFAETARLPAALYRWITPVAYRDEDGAASQLRRLGIAADDVRYVVLSHFHADHIGGARDFPQARFIYREEAYRAVARLGKLASVRAGYLPGLLPDDLAARSRPLEACAAVKLPGTMPFACGYDVFGDGSIVAVDIPGHAAGQIGLFLSTGPYTYFLCADAVWSSRAYREGRPPHRLAGLIMDNREQYRDSFERIRRLHEAHPDIRIVPSHCGEALAGWADAEEGGGGRWT